MKYGAMDLNMLMDHVASLEAQARSEELQRIELMALQRDTAAQLKTGMLNNLKSMLHAMTRFS
jgi:hypothetical protein